MAQLRPKIVKLAKIIGGVTGITTKIDENAPEYYCMAGILTDEEADVAIAAGLRKERTAAYLAKKVGKTVQEVQPLLDNLVYYGIFRRSKDEALGEDVYYMQIFAPGILEMMVNQKELLDTHPEVGRAFEEYTRNLAANMGAMIPDGYGLMRVIPVESALEGIPGVNEFERISHYLDKYDRFSVSPCSCRASRTSIGDGCGHLDEDMCIQMGKGAEHYIRSGRAKEITREQALEIIKRAEENGLMHDMVNIEEPGESAAICNCCACACFGLRVGLMYGARDAIRSNYVAEVDEAKCVACGQCVETCPGNALKLGQKLCSTEDLTPKPDYVKLSETLRPKRSWDPNYREDHEDVVPTGTAPCKTACPAHIPVQGYLKLAAQGRYTDALELIKKENPFPAVCGRICNKRCEAECTRGDVDEAVAIDEVKRFIADHDLHEATRYVPKLLNQIGRPYTEKIAVIGAGPAGMSCAYYLANKGYPVTVFDRNPVPGGMLTLGIPSFRLEKDVLNAEIDILREMGVEFRCGVEVGKDVTIEQLRAQGYKGFYVAIGAQKSAKLRIPGEELTGVYGGVDFLRAVNLGHETNIGKRCAVIGGGNVAMDVCRSAVRLGADETYVLYRRSEAELPADPEEVKEAMDEGVQFRFLTAPVEILGADGKVTGIRVERMTLASRTRRAAASPSVPANLRRSRSIPSSAPSVRRSTGARSIPARSRRRKRAPPRPTRLPIRPRSRTSSSAATATPARSLPSTPLPPARRPPSACTAMCTPARRSLPAATAECTRRLIKTMCSSRRPVLTRITARRRATTPPRPRPSPTRASRSRKSRCAKSAPAASAAVPRRWTATCASAAACAPRSASSTPSISRRCATGTQARMRPCRSRSPRVSSSARAAS